MQYTTLSNGIQMPLLGYGVFQVPPQEAERCVADALSVGYRLLTPPKPITTKKAWVPPSRNPVYLVRIFSW